MPSYSKEVKILGKTSDQLYEKVAVEIDRMLEKSNLGKYEVVRRPEKKELEIKSSLFSAVLKCTDGKISLNGKIGMMALPFKAKIDSGIDRWLAKTFV